MIADLNGRITTGEASGEEASEERDSRDKLLTDLGELVDIHSFEDEEGRATVLLDEH